MPKAEALTSPFWIDGTITTPVSEAVYDAETFYVFNFSVSNTNNTLLVTVGSEISVACAVDIAALAGVTFEQNGFYNFTGAINDVQTSEFPVDTFLVYSINNGGGWSDWTQIIIQIIDILSSVMRGIATTIAQLLELFAGVVVPEAVITLVLVAGLAFFVIKNLKTLSILFVVVVGFLIVSGGANIIRLIVT